MKEDPIVDRHVGCNDDRATTNLPFVCLHDARRAVFAVGDLGLFEYVGAISFDQASERQQILAGVKLGLVANHHRAFCWKRERDISREGAVQPHLPRRVGFLLQPVQVGVTFGIDVGRDAAEATLNPLLFHEPGDSIEGFTR